MFFKGSPNHWKTKANLVIVTMATSAFWVIEAEWLAYHEKRLKEAIRSYWIMKWAVSHKLIYLADIFPNNPRIHYQSMFFGGFLWVFLWGVVFFQY